MSKKFKFVMAAGMLTIIIALAGCSSNKAEDDLSASVQTEAVPEVSTTTSPIGSSEEAGNVTQNNSFQPTNQETQFVDTADLEEENEDEQQSYVGKTLAQLQDEGLIIIEEQSFEAELQDWGAVHFVSGYSNANHKGEQRFYLINKDGKAEYRLPRNSASRYELEDILAVSFKDINHDGEKDIIIIGNYKDARAGANGGSLTWASVYFSDHQYFVPLLWLDDLLNRTDGSKSIAGVTGEAALIYNEIANLDDDEIKIEHLAALICSSKMLEKNSLKYVNTYDSTAIFMDYSTYLHKSLMYLLGQCFNQDIVHMLAGHDELAEKVKIYDELLGDILSEVIDYNYVKSGKGTMWQEFAANYNLEYRAVIHSYVVGNIEKKMNSRYADVDELQKVWEQVRSLMLAFSKTVMDENDDGSMISQEELDEMAGNADRIDRKVTEFIGLAKDDTKAGGLIDFMIEAMDMTFSDF
ncbi:hypothetical protein [Paenibacillus sp. Leaf72]|uniref:hypothetical protein n=1 Tax=Paenibacillus sp. Leaf72 TaxID=1736234 RepID=UPI0006F821D8|nr:hypothetical protein [Paenibacillus sp. Leaf72]KQO17840.1 hypothetical protein ASF12_04055 [Paenibacillus sp. Leaf72]